MITMLAVYLLMHSGFCKTGTDQQKYTTDVGAQKIDYPDTLHRLVRRS